MELDDVRWRTIDHVSSGTLSLPDLLRTIERIKSWNSPLGQIPKTGPWRLLTDAVYDRGKVRGAFYAVLPHLASYAKGRSPADQSSVLTFCLLNIFHAADVARDIPAELAASFEEGLLDLWSLARTVLDAEELPVNARMVAAAVELLSDRDLLLTRVAYGLLWTYAAVLCCVCSEKIEFRFDGARWRVGVRREDMRSATATFAVALGQSRPLPQNRLASLAELGREHGFGAAYEHITELDAVVTCSTCHDSRRVLELVAAGLRRRCPLARMKGWEPKVNPAGTSPSIAPPR
jgi:hypothetical protein